MHARIEFKFMSAAASCSPHTDSAFSQLAVADLEQAFGYGLLAIT